MAGVKGKTGIYKRTEETKKKVSLNHARYWLGKRGKLHPSYGKKLSEETKRKISESEKGRVGYWMGKKRPISEETRKKISQTTKGRRPKNNLTWIKEGHPNWKGGISGEPYPSRFNEQLKLKIRTRDNFICCLCGKTEREELEELNRVLCVNHIDFNKKNCGEENLNTLCLRCNVKINRNRDYWTDYFLQI